MFPVVMVGWLVAARLLLLLLLLRDLHLCVRFARFCLLRPLLWRSLSVVLPSRVCGSFDES